MKKIICDIRFGLAKQVVHVLDSDTGKYETFKLSLQEIPQFFFNYNDIEEVQLGGPIAFTSKIERTTRELENQKYSDRKKIRFYYI